MKKWLIRYLVFNLLALSVPTNYTISIFKLGFLISHFQNHTQEGHKTSFLSFLASHYLDKKHHEANHCDHEKLPFHDHHGEGVNFASQTPLLQPEAPSDLGCSKLQVQSTKMIATVTSSHISSYLGDIWQPPKR